MGCHKSHKLYHKFAISSIWLLFVQKVWVNCATIKSAKVLYMRGILDIL